MVCDVANDEVIAIKRAGWGQGAGKSVKVDSRPTAKVSLKLPEPSRDGKGRKVDVIVLSDTYVGLEHRLMGIDIPALPVVDDEVDKTKKGG